MEVDKISPVDQFLMVVSVHLLECIILIYTTLVV